MVLTDLNLKHSYDSDEDDILNDFYIPVLENSYKYYRLAGFFRSSSLAVAARGIEGLLKNNGEMKLIAGAFLSKKDVDAIKEGTENPQQVIENTMIKDLNDIKDEFVKDHIKALSWMVAKKKLFIKIAIVTDQNGTPFEKDQIEQEGIFHQKIGIFEDIENNRLSFNGSTNESASAWKKNIEDFNVFRQWIEAERPYLETDIKRFHKFWNGEATRTKIIDVPKAIHEKLISLAPSQIKDINLNKWNSIKKIVSKKIELRPYQNEAISNWITNNKLGIFEMATGTGKTFTALGCINEIIKNYKKIVVIISCPYQHLIQQWSREIDKFGILTNKLIADSSNPTWKDELANILVDVSLGYKDKVFVLTTHSTLCSNDFKDIIEQNKDANYCLIGDEVHGLGAEKSRTGLLNQYKFRLGLSATPRRWYDDSGTNTIYEYFGGVVYEFDLWKAINTINPHTGDTFLSPYRYLPRFISLNEVELLNYEKISKSILKMFEQIKTDSAKEEILERLLFQRANIVKNAEEKYQVLENILNDLGVECKYTIIYCSPQQIDRVSEILKRKRIIYSEFTMEQKTKPEEKYSGLSERDYILEKFADGTYHVLIAMKCLDEGVDIPPARKTILLASSGNPREYIQRIGRVIRRYPGKTEAAIFDIIVVPSFKRLSKELRDIESDVFEKELKRYEEIGKNAINNAEALKIIYDLKNENF